MAKLPPPLDGDLRARFAAAREADRVADLTEPRARAAWYDPPSGRIVVELRNGAAVAFPPDLFPELRRRTPQQLAKVEPSPSGEGLHWDDMDVHLETAGVLVELLGASMFRAFASVGGRARTERKAAAARENGRKGGRPRKEPEGHRYRPDPDFGVTKVAETRQPRPPGEAPPPSDEG